jgi:hypothetical protein
MLLTKFHIIWPSGFRGKAVLEIDKKNASYHVSVHLAKLFQSRRFLEIDQSETRIAYDGHVC